MEEKTVDEVYTNTVEISTTPFDFTTLFGIDQVVGDNGEKQNTKLVKVRMSPQLAKAYCALLAQQVASYESSIGEINVPGVTKNSGDK